MGESSFHEDYMLPYEEFVQQLQPYPCVEE